MLLSPVPSAMVSLKGFGVAVCGGPVSPAEPGGMHQEQAQCVQDASLHAEAGTQVPSQEGGLGRSQS